jgi:CBS-domain-containing membrane protein
MPKSGINHLCPLCKEIIRTIDYDSPKQKIESMILTDEVCASCAILLEQQLLLVHPPSGAVMLVDLVGFQENFPEFIISSSHVLAVSLETCQLLLGRLCQDAELEK